MADSTYNPNDYKVLYQKRIRQTGIHKGETYTYKKFQNKKTGVIVKDSAALQSVGVFHKIPKIKTTAGQQPRTYITAKFLIKNYALRKDCSFGKVGEIQEPFIAYKTETQMDFIDQHGVFEDLQSTKNNIDDSSLGYHFKKYFGKAEVEIQNFDIRYKSDAPSEQQKVDRRKTIRQAKSAAKKSSDGYDNSKMFIA